jgi:hypothetical protein
MFVLFVGCQRERGSAQTGIPGSGNHPPSIRAASILPSPLVLNGPISVTIDAQDLDRNPLSFRYQWRVNGKPIASEQGEQLPPELLKQGDQVAVEIWPHDGVVEGASFTTPTVIVRNSPPVVSQVSIEPSVISLGMRVRAQVKVYDADHDLIRVAYRWWRNQTLVQEGEEAELDTATFAHGDVLAVEVLAGDHSGVGQSVRSTPAKIGNTPPRIISIPPTSLSHDQFAYQVEASDAESDALTFSLESAPSGMTIDERNGLVTWHVPPGHSGIDQVRILVTDSQGAASFQAFEVNVSIPTPPEPPHS